jgi:SAM-dependent methyltransferase
MKQIGRAAVSALPPATERRVRRLLGERQPRRVALADLESELSNVAALFATSEDQARDYLAYLVLDVPDDQPADPFSREYQDWTWRLYRGISGRAAEYSTANEDSPFDLPRALVRPFPFETGSAKVVGDDLAARGHLLRCLGEDALGLAPPARIVEFGPGWGNLTNDLVSTGFHVTAVEISEQFCTLIRERCAIPANLTLVQSDMLTFAATEPFDAAIFFESFHHCSDHLALLRNLHQIVRPGGVVFFASEPVTDMPYPWGPRLDGLSLWSTRHYGWLELGFDGAYFEAALAHTGWKAERRVVGRKPGIADVLVASPIST